MPLTQFITLNLDVTMVSAMLFQFLLAITVRGTQTGPKYWGLLNPRWKLCDEGRRQSPVNIELSTLLFDPTLPYLTIYGDKTKATFVNTGNGITMNLDDRPRGRHIYVISGPLSYRYLLHRVMFHFSRLETGGSEHSIGGVTFPAEIQLLGYNTDLYNNASEAEQSPHGLVAVALFVQVQKKDNFAFNTIARELKKVIIRGSTTAIKELDMRLLLPDTKLYVTYEGSQTYPGCHETITWIILNKPLFLSDSQLSILSTVNQGGRDNPQMFLEHNRRPVKPLNQRPVRTNIDVLTNYTGTDVIRRHYRRSLCIPACLACVLTQKHDIQIPDRYLILSQIHHAMGCRMSHCIVHTLRDTATPKLDAIKSMQMKLLPVTY